MSIQINEQTARKLYPDSPEWLKKILIEEFGEEKLKQKDYESIKSFEDACKELGKKPSDVFSNTHLPDEIAYKKLKVIVKAINDEWIPDWRNSNEKKWYPWFNLSSGFGFSYSDYYDSGTYTDVGSRLCFNSAEKAEFAGMQFTDLYKEFLTIS